MASFPSPARGRCRRLRTPLPNLNVPGGGGCGTDHRHGAARCAAWQAA
jgi:hypothetical protein